MFNKHCILLLVNVCLCLSELTIAPTGQIVINEGDPLEITCTDSEDVNFIYPENILDLVVTSEINIQSSFTNNKYTEKFERRKTVYADSGWYGCANQPKKYLMPVKSKFPMTPDLYTDSNIQWVYVFVKSTDHLFLDAPHLHEDNGKFYIEGKVGKDVLLPCRLSSPDYTVKLYSGGKVIDAEFDPKKGMLIKNLKANSPVDYACVITLDNGSKKSMDFEIEMPDQLRYDLGKPSIVTKALKNIEIGGTIEIDCTVFVWIDNDFVLTWAIPTKTRDTSHSMDLKEEKVSLRSSIRKVTAVLTIKDVIAEDFGEYECRYYKPSSVKIEKLNLSPHAIFLTPVTTSLTFHDENAGDSKNPDSAVDAYSLVIVNQKMNVTKGSTMTMHCSASTDKFSDDIKWYINTQLLATDGRVAIKKTKTAQSHSSQLTVANVTKLDEGEYTCEGTTKNGLIIKNHYHVHVNASAVFSASVILHLSIILLSYFM